MFKVEDDFHVFEADLVKFAKTIGVEFDKVFRRVALELHDKIIEATPVSTGRARASWNMSLNEPDESTAPDTSKGVQNRDSSGRFVAGKTRGGGMSAGAAADRSRKTQKSISKMDAFKDTIWITNAVPYIRELEKGSSRQAPAGMVAKALAEVEAGLLAALR